LQILYQISRQKSVKSRILVLISRHYLSAYISSCAKAEGEGGEGVDRRGEGIPVGIE